MMRWLLFLLHWHVAIQVSAVQGQMMSLPMFCGGGGGGGGKRAVEKGQWW